jgi:hypothetical protein
MWHSSCPKKVGSLIWLTLNRALPIGTWLQCMGISPSYKVCRTEASETPQHCLFDCPVAKRAWEAFRTIWLKWGTPKEITPTWPFILLGEDASLYECEDDLPGL